MRSARLIVGLSVVVGLTIVAACGGSETETAPATDGGATPDAAPSDGRAIDAAASEASADDAHNDATRDAPSEAANANDGGEDAQTDASVDASAVDGAPTDASGDALSDAADAADAADACPLDTVTGSASCGSGGYSPTSYVPARACAPELFFASTYEASSDHTKPYPGTVNFNVVGRPNAVLVVSSYEAVSWNIKLGPGASLAKVIVLGYKASTATVPSGVLVDNETPLSTKYCYQMTSSADACIAYAKSLAGGGDNAGMWGCYNAASFTIQ